MEANKDNAHNKLVADILVSLHSLTENLQNQGRYEEAEGLCRRKVTIAEETYGHDDSTTLESREKLAMIVQKRKLAIYYQRWKLEPLENILELDRRNIPKPDQSDAMILGAFDQKAKDLENQNSFNEAKEELWPLVERKEMLGPYHLRTLMTMCDLARALRLDRNLADAETLYWLAFAISDDIRGARTSQHTGDHEQSRGMHAFARQACRMQGNLLAAAGAPSSISGLRPP